MCILLTSCEGYRRYLFELCAQACLVLPCGKGFSVVKKMYMMENSFGWRYVGHKIMVACVVYRILCNRKEGEDRECNDFNSIQFQSRQLILLNK